MAQIGNWKIKGCLGNGGNATVLKFAMTLVNILR